MDFGAGASAERLNPTDRLRHLGEQVREIVGVLLFHLEDLLAQPPRSRIVVAEPTRDLGVGLNRRSLGYLLARLLPYPVSCYQSPNLLKE